MSNNMNWDEEDESSSSSDDGLDFLRKMKEMREENERLIAEYDRVSKLRQELFDKYSSKEVFKHLKKLNLTTTAETPFGRAGAWKSKMRALKGMKNRENFLEIALDYTEHARREQETFLIVEEFQKRENQQQRLHKHKQKKEAKLSKLRHPEDLQEKNRLSRMLDNATIFKNRIDSKRADEHDELMKERVVEMLEIRKQERDTKRKMLFYIKTEEEKLWKLREERERMKEVKKKAKLNKIAKRQRQLEIEERVARQKVIDLWRVSSTILEPSVAADFLPPEPINESRLIFA